MLLLKLFKKIIKCCKKNSDTKKETETHEQDKSEQDDDRKGPEIEIFKDGDILKDGSPRTQSSHSAKILTEHTDIKINNKENMAGTKQSHSGTSSLIIKKSKHDSGDKTAASGALQGSKHKMAAPRNRRDSKEPAAEPSKNRRTSEDKVQVARSSHGHKNVAMEKTEPSPPQVKKRFS